MRNLMDKYDRVRTMHGLTLGSAELYRRGGNSDQAFRRDEPSKTTRIKASTGAPLKIDVGISAAGGGSSIVRQKIHSNEDLEILVRAALTSMDKAARRSLVSDIVRTELETDGD